MQLINFLLTVIMRFIILEIYINRQLTKVLCLLGMILVPIFCYNCNISFLPPINRFNFVLYWPLGMSHTTSISFLKVCLYSFVFLFLGVLWIMEWHSKSEASYLVYLTRCTCACLPKTRSKALC